MIRDLITRCLDRWANLPFLVRGLIAVTVVGGLGLLAFKPGYRWFRQWRLERNLVNAREAVEQTRMQEARDLSLTVLRAGDPRIEAFRILEKSTASLRDPRHAEIARALISHPEGSDEDRLNGFVGVVDRTPLGLVGQSWVALPESCRKDPRFAVSFARRLLAERRAGEAASVLLAVPEADRNGEVNRGLVAVLIGSGRREGFQEAQKRIAEDFPAGGAEAVQWLEMLESIPAVSLDGGLLEPLRGRLEAMNEVSPGRRALMLARLDYAGRFQQRAVILEKASSDWRSRDPLEFARFLHGLGLHRDLLESFSDADAAGGATLNAWLRDAACRSADWDRLRRLLDAGGADLPRVQELGWRAVLALKTGDAVAGADAWAAAMNDAAAATGDDAYLVLHRIASDAALPEQAHQAMLAAIRAGRGPLPLYSDLKPLLQSLVAQGQEKALLEIGAIYLHFEPGNPVLITQYAYLACLNELVEPASVLQALEPLAEALPEEVPIQCALATAFLCDSKPEKAAEVLDRLKVDPGQLPPSFRIVFLVSRVRQGALPADDPAVKEFPWNDLLPSERRKFGALLKG